jgi:hypothetical protein
MSFVRKKEIPSGSGNWYDYEVATVHIGGKTIQKHIQYLGKKGKYNKPLIGDKVDTIRIHGLSKPIMGNNYQRRIRGEICRKHYMYPNTKIAG